MVNNRSLQFINRNLELQCSVDGEIDCDQERIQRNVNKLQIGF